MTIGWLLTILLLLLIWVAHHSVRSFSIVRSFLNVVNERLTSIHRTSLMQKHLWCSIVLLILSAFHYFNWLLEVLLVGLFIQELAWSHNFLRDTLVRNEPIILSRKVLRLVFHTLNNYEYSNWWWLIDSVMLIQQKTSFTLRLPDPQKQTSDQ